MTEQDRQRLVRLLGMLGSEHAGERDNAARLAEQIRRENGTTWDDLLTGQVVYVDRPLVVEKYLPPRISLEAVMDRCLVTCLWVGIPLALVFFLGR